MGFRAELTEEEEQDRYRAAETLLAMLRGLDEEIEDDDSDDAQEDIDNSNVVDLRTTTKIEKLNIIIHNLLNDLITGDVKFSNAREVSETIEAVHQYNQLKTFLQGQANG